MTLAVAVDAVIGTVHMHSIYLGFPFHLHVTPLAAMVSSRLGLKAWAHDQVGPGIGSQRFLALGWWLVLATVALQARWCWQHQSTAPR